MLHLIGNRLLVMSPVLVVVSLAAFFLRSMFVQFGMLPPTGQLLPISLARSV